MIGQALDNDGRQYTLAGVLVRPSGVALSVTLNRIELNRDDRPDAAHLRSPAGAQELSNIEVELTGAWIGGDWTVGVGYDDASRPALASTARGFVRYSRGLR
jgi:hypothetical protein